MKILVLGVSGMLGSAVFRYLSLNPNYEVFGSARSPAAARHFLPELRERIISGIDVENQDALVRLFRQARPDAVINCVGLIKQLSDANDPLLAIPINSLLPHRLANLCDIAQARLVHISTDCVFSGTKGNYLESDFSDAYDLYGRSKYLGEVDYPHAVTLRTSIIGHELNGTAHALLEWFLAQQGRTNGYTRAIFSGLPTVELASVIGDVVLPNEALRGLYHVAAQPIAKFDLLQLVAQVYGKQIEIIPQDTLQIDRSLDATRFKLATGYCAPAWQELIQRMFNFQVSRG